MRRRTSWLGLTVFVLSCAGAASCGGAGDITFESGSTGSGGNGAGNNGTGGDGDGGSGAGVNVGGGPNTGGGGVGGANTGGANTGGANTGGGGVCSPGSTEPCYSGPQGTEGIGACKAGTRTCNDDGLGWGDCKGEELPAGSEDCATPEDDDCNGKSNEGCACVPNTTAACYSGPRNTAGVGICKAGTQTCDAKGQGYGPCSGEVDPGAETCGNALDDDCDGQVDEGCVCVPNTTAPCYSGPAGTENVGVCKSGTKTCSGDGTSWGACVGEVVPQAESCLTPSDENCNGAVNEGCVCTPNTTASCYSGPMGTADIGACKSGLKACSPDGTGYGACMGEVGPVAEVCGNQIDDDCDGVVDDGCACAPNTTAACYSGPMGTQGVGVCKGGTKTCNAQGTAYGACVGEVLPGNADVCGNALDDNCNGQVNEGCGVVVPIIDLRADTNRNGTVDLADPTEDLAEDQWTKDHGAVFLANIDDDTKKCPTSNQTDAQLAACNDASDTIVNGVDDLEDLARIKTVPWPTAPNDASATVAVSAAAANYVRLFKNVNGTFQLFTPGQSTITAAELKAGVELAIEGKDIVRNAQTWNGLVTVTLNVDAGTGPNGPLQDGSDAVQLRVAPMMFRHHLDPATTVYASNINSNASQAFRNDLNAGVTAAGVPGGLVTFSVSDQWNQDYFETAYMAMPAVGGQKVIHVNVRSANYGGNNTLRSAGRVVYTSLRGKDVAGLTQYDPNHSNSMDSLNSFGNLETIPPHTFNGTSYPMGRVLRGATQAFYPDKSFDTMITAQAVQPIVYIDTEWLLVGHVDETLSFIKASSPRGWVMLAADPTLGKNMLTQLQQQGNGAKQMFVGKFWANNTPATVTINQVLADADVMNTSAWAATKIDGQLTQLKAATGITDAEIVKLAGLFESSSGYAVAYQPGMVNGIYLSNTLFGVPKPYGPDINGQDPFRLQVQNALQPYGVNVQWIEDWDLYHRLDGEVHCGSNTTRAIPQNVKWWESGL